MARRIERETRRARAHKKLGTVLAEHQRHSAVCVERREDRRCCHGIPAEFHTRVLDTYEMPAAGGNQRVEFRNPNPVQDLDNYNLVSQFVKLERFFIYCVRFGMLSPRTIQQYRARGIYRWRDQEQAERERDEREREHRRRAKLAAQPT